MLRLLVVLSAFSFGPSALSADRQGIVCASKDAEHFLIQQTVSEETGAPRAFDVFATFSDLESCIAASANPGVQRPVIAPLPSLLADSFTCLEQKIGDEQSASHLVRLTRNTESGVVFSITYLNTFDERGLCEAAVAL